MIEVVMIVRIINLVVSSISSFCLLPGLLQVLLQGYDPLLVLIGLALENLLGTLGVVSSGTGLVELGDGGHHLLLGLLQVLLQARDTPGSIVSTITITIIIMSTMLVIPPPSGTC